VTAVFLSLLCWLVIETQGGGALGVAERLTSSVQTTWPFVVAVVLWRHAARTGRLELPGEPPEVLPRAADDDGRVDGRGAGRPARLISACTDPPRSLP
jgi:hypothetical protein